MIIDEEFIDKCVKKNKNALIPILQDMQEHYNYLPEEVLRKVANKLQTSLIDIYGVATFYHSFSLTPKGKHIIFICLGTACYVRGGVKIVDALSREL
ncbi:MAG: NAD(P)H-dependent oxidoreductase subunit E, partial [Candidatus Helarchaeota archaeon]|nr:NAD(P)H-dependent oxidoreductase subunit E [Candidatus Helarchaeota archaeon]